MFVVALAAYWVYVGLLYCSPYVCVFLISIRKSKGKKLCFRIAYNTGKWWDKAYKKIDTLKPYMV